MKKISAALAAVMFALALGGCGGSDRTTVTTENVDGVGGTATVSAKDANGDGVADDGVYESTYCDRYGDW
jgi:hypothetical protein